MRLVLVLALICAPALAFAQPQQDPHVQAPVRRKHVDPEYPKALLDSGKDVEVVLTLTIDAQGKVENAEVSISGGTEFDKAALEAARSWEFDPATRDGKPVHSKIRVPFHFAPPHAPTHATSTVPSQATEEEAHKQPPPPPPQDSDLDTVNIFGRSHIPTRGVGDHDIPIGKLAAVPRAEGAAGLMKLAPGVTLQNEGGNGHPYQIFMRGFDAAEGGDVEMSVDGIPINDTANVHGTGLADTHFLIPEVIRKIRVMQGPFAPQQGNFGVAGSILFDPGVDETGITAKVTAGSFGTRRLLLLWRPEGCSERTFAAGEIYGTDGFGSNRSAERATAMGGYEGRVGASMAWRLLVTSYAQKWKQAGVVREDDVLQGKIAASDTYDPGQGGDSARHSIGLTITDKLGAVRLRQTVFGILRDFRVRDNTTGFLEDPRGDLIDQQMRAGIVGARGSARAGMTGLGQRQEIELGYYARYDAVSGVQERDRSGTSIAYKRDLDLSSGLTNLGLFVDSSLKPTSWITVRGGMRADLFHSRVTDQLGSETATNVASAWQPRGTLFLGPVKSVTFSASIGRAARTFAPQDILGGQAPPIAQATSYEVGASFDRPFGATEVHARSVFFGTQLDHDLLFDETTGRNTLAPGNFRSGWLGSVRVTGRWIDVSSSATVVKTIDDATHGTVAYVPPIVLRNDVVVFGDLPWPRISGRKITGTVGVGMSYVGRRPLPDDATAPDYLLLDAGGSLKWRWIDLGVSATNVLDQKWHSADFNYASDFGTQPGNMQPVRHYVLGQPAAVFVNLGVTL